MENKKILLVDDDMDFKESIKVILEAKNYTIEMASDMTEGFEKVKSFKPDAILLDVQMTSKHEGFEMNQKLKSDPEFKNIPVLMLTGIEVTVTSNNELVEYAREMRTSPNFMDMEVILLKNYNKECGIDYKTSEGKSQWLKVDGFLSKPVESEELYKELELILK